MIHYLILTHKNPEQLEILINKLSSTKSKVYVHIDWNSNIDEFNYLKNKAIFIKKRVKIRRWWYSMVDWTLGAFEEILKNMSEKDHLVIMSWQDLPIKSQDFINKFLNNYIWKSFLEYRIQPNNEWNILNRIIKYHFHDLIIPNYIDNFIKKIVWLFFDTSWLRNQVFCFIFQRFVNFFMPVKKYLYNNYKLYWWSSWMIISKNHIDLIINFCNTKKWKKFVKGFKTVAWPDEIFFQTLLLNTEEKNNIINDVLWYIDWKKWPWLPRILDVTDLEEIKKSDKLFARKFDLQVDKEIFYKIIN